MEGEVRTMMTVELLVLLLLLLPSACWDEGKVGADCGRDSVGSGKSVSDMIAINALAVLETRSMLMYKVYGTGWAIFPQYQM